VQSDWQLHAFHGTDLFEQSGPHERFGRFPMASPAMPVVGRLILCTGTPWLLFAGIQIRS
jgi:hypothetical protein